MARAHIGFLIVNRANLARSQTVIDTLIKEDVEITIFSASAFILEKFGSAVQNLPKSDNVKISTIFCHVEGETLETQSKTTALLVYDLTSQLASREVDCLVVIADRFEVIAGAIAASYQNIPLVHIQGGEISGNIDDKVRNAVSCMADLHFPCSNEAFERLVANSAVRGEKLNYGCPAMDLLHGTPRGNPFDILVRSSHVGNCPEQGEKYVLAVYHPETEHFDDLSNRYTIFLESVLLLRKSQKIVMLWPNNDAGSDKVAKIIRVYREKGLLSDVAIYKNFSPADYIEIMRGASFLIGNSSSFLREGRHLGKSAVLVGDRQRGRDLGRNVVICDIDPRSMQRAIEEVERLAVDPPSDSPYGKGNAGAQIAKKIIGFVSSNSNDKD